MNRRTEQMHRLRQERDRLLAQIEALKNQVVGIDRAIAVLDGTEYHENLERQSRDRTRNVKDTVLGLLAEAGTKGLTVAQVIEFAKIKGIELDRSSVSSLLSRLKRESTLDLKEGRYFVRAPKPNGNERPFAH